MAVSYFCAEKTRLFYLYWFIPGLLIGLWFHVYLVHRYGGTPGKVMVKTWIAMVDRSLVTIRLLFLLAVCRSTGILKSTLLMSDELYFFLRYVARVQRAVQTAPSWHGVVTMLMHGLDLGELVTMLFNKKRRAVHEFMAGQSSFAPPDLTA